MLQTGLLELPGNLCLVFRRETPDGLQPDDQDSLNQRVGLQVQPNQFNIRNDF